MADNQENFEITDEETGEVFTIRTTSLVSNIRDVLLSRRRAQTEATVWSKLTEQQQKDEITAMHELARGTVNKVVEVVAEAGQTCAHVEVTKFAVDVDKGVVTITSAGHASDEMLVDLAHAKGRTAKITVVDAQQFNQHGQMPKPDKDQPDLLPDDEKADEGSDRDGMSDAEIDATAAEMDAQLDDTDGLHDQDADDDGVSREWKAGNESRWAGYAQMRNPFMGEGNGTAQQFTDWDDGWRAADDQDDVPKVDETLGADPSPDGDEETSAEYREGWDARMKAGPQHENPYKGKHGKAQERADWSAGWVDADEDETAPSMETGEVPQPDQETPDTDVTTDADDSAPDAEQVSDAEWDPQTFKDAGTKAALEGAGPDDNPHDGGTEVHNAWAEGYAKGQEGVEELRSAGYKARKGGMAPNRCTWKADTPERTLWMEGYNLAKSEE